MNDWYLKHVEAELIFKRSLIDAVNSLPNSEDVYLMQGGLAVRNEINYLTSKIIVQDHGDSGAGVNAGAIYEVDIVGNNESIRLEHLQEIADQLEKFMVVGEIVRNGNYTVTIHSIKRKKKNVSSKKLTLKMQFIYATS